MNGAGRQQAVAALDAARPLLGRLDVSGHPEDVAADLIEGWSAVEAALRSLVGGTALTGQALVRELRQREVLSLDTAHALLEFLGARDRVQRTSYRPTGADVTLAREAFRRLDAELRAPAAVATGAAAGAATAGPPSPYAPGAATGGAGPRSVPVPNAAPTTAGAAGTAGPAAPLPPVMPPRGAKFIRGGARGGIFRSPIVLALLAIVAVAGGYFGYLALAPRPDPLARGVELFRAGNRDAARVEFERVARANPRLAAPHVFLGRIAREGGDYTAANRELQQAIQLEPSNTLALREMGQYLLAAGNPDLARRFLARAVQADSTDAAATGWLGCALIRNGQRDVGERFLRRAGPGDWSGCLNQAAPLPPLPGTPATARPNAAAPPAT